MTLSDLAPKLHKVKWQGSDHLMASCPCHDDQNPSLSIRSTDDGKILVHCFTGCNTNDIVHALGLEMKDLFPDFPEGNANDSSGNTGGSRALEAEYLYNSGTLKKQRYRHADGTKSFCWMTLENGKWIASRKTEPELYCSQATLPKDVILVEGEKDVDTLGNSGVAAVSLPDGANSTWKLPYNDFLRGKNVVILPDNDLAGQKYASMCAEKLAGVAECVRIVDLTQVWPEIPEKGDISDMIARFGATTALAKVNALIASTPVWTSQSNVLNDPLLALFKPLSEFEEEDALWLIPGWIPESQITLFSADGGLGKTKIWCHIAAALSNGRTCFLDPVDHKREPIRILFFSGEDSVTKKLRKDLRLAGANMDNIITMDVSADKNHLLSNVKLGSPALERVIRHYRPHLCILDPLQAFIPPDINMGSRNAMRDCMAPLVALGEEIGTAFLVVCHTNKRSSVSGRSRVADSADLWDISRSVIMAGVTRTQGIQYLSHEKSNYGPLQETLLYSIVNGQPVLEGTSWKRDADFMAEASTVRSKPQRDDCRDFLLQTLGSAPGYRMESVELDRKAEIHGHSRSTISRAKKELKDENIISYSTTGAAKNGNRTWYTNLVASTTSDFPDLYCNEPTPFDADTPSA